MKLDNPSSPPFSKGGLGGFKSWLIGLIKMPKARVCLLILSKYARIPPSFGGGMNGLPSPVGGEGLGVGEMI
jgi:hypothetical protein